MSAAFLLLALAWSPGAASAQDATGTLHLTIRDAKTGQPVPARVEIRGADGAYHVARDALTFGAVASQFSMSDSWRVGVDESEKTELDASGLFAWVRNPIFSFMGLSLLGLLMMVPSSLAVFACLLTLVGIQIQVRVVEEPYLERTHGKAYARYRASVGRFVPRVGRMSMAHLDASAGGTQ